MKRTACRRRCLQCGYYRYTGNSRNWQRLARRNGISNPLFVPGGVSIEVINE
ncbi:hypothetical protein AB2F98_01685 [Escherichia coli]